MRKKWEYKMDSHLISDMNEPYDACRILNAYGEEGWEIVNFVDDLFADEVNWRTYLFKREKKE